MKKTKKEKRRVGGEMRGLAALISLLTVGAALAVVVLTIQSRSSDHGVVLEPASSEQLVAKLRALLAEKASEKQTREKMVATNAHTELAAAAAHWKAARSDWTPYNPSLSLTQNKLDRQAAGDARETELNEESIVNKLAVHGKDAGPHKPYIRAGLERYQANMYDRHPKKACADWGSHPIDCIRAAYGNHLKGTKFAPLRRHYDGRVTETSLDHERNLISKKVSEGLIKGSIKPPKNDRAVTSWLHRVKSEMRAARKLAMQRALASRIKREERHADEVKVAKEWASGVAASGPEAGRRYYVNYATGKTSFSAPKYVKQALRDIRLREKAKAEHAVQREAALYEEGFRAAQHEMLVKDGRTTSLSEVSPPRTSLVGKRRLEQIHAEKAINNFLRHGGRHPKASKYTWKDLAAERARIAHELGYKSLTHQKGRLSEERAAPTQQLSLKAVQQKVIVDAWGHPLTHTPTASDYPMGSGEYEQPAAAAKPEGSAAAAQASAAQEEQAAGEPAAATAGAQVTVAKAVEKVAAAVKEKTDALQQEVEAQQAIINDLEHKVAEQTRAKTRESTGMDAASPLPAAAAGRLVERATRGRVREQQKPALGSFEMAKFANNVGTGTNIVDVYDGLKDKADYAQVANEGGQLRSAKDFAAIRDEVRQEVNRHAAVAAAAQSVKVAADLAQVAKEAKEVGGEAVAQQALAAVKSAMRSAANHAQENAQVEAVVASGDLPPPLHEDEASGMGNAKVVLPSADLDSSSKFLRRLAVESAPVNKAKMTAVARRTLNRMVQSSGEGAEMI